ncbi:SUF system Fe-S cluster assembly protein [Bartonella sp. TP]|uniref:SUF system Fe-S cluster assembly protein n=1 Tax=Bartonella sp. TP TaxID=3057550 RepID=UPI0025B0977A|nr:SUF system Fe-S cluster assembly protein [Bartonella sp. TP]MDN5249274.1 SUF system Fe-S cluster assembly protein [Alphaproteobacteria bacterium]WJW79964.1 SUF system Fe-S cluster assembly protein [Bartonella sp. TP]
MESEETQLTKDIIAALKTVYDPEIPVDVYELGLIYKVDIEEGNVIKILMTLTAPNCPVAGDLPKWVEDAVSAVEGVQMAEVTLTFTPPWTKDLMSEEAQIALNYY